MLLTFDFRFVVFALAGRTAKVATTNLFLIEPLDQFRSDGKEGDLNLYTVLG